MNAKYACLIKLCLRRGFSREDSEDIVQDAYMRLADYQQSRRVMDADSVLRRIVKLSTLREPQAPLVRRLDRLDRRGMLIDPAPGPERLLDGEQQLEEVVNTLRKQSRRTCQIFLTQRGGYSYEEIAAGFAIKPRTVEKHVTYGTLIVLEREGDGVPPVE